MFEDVFYYVIQYIGKWLYHVEGEMKKSTNVFILKYALLPILVFIAYAFLVPESIEGTQDPRLIHWIAQILWVPGCMGVLAFWVWGVMANFLSMMLNGLEIEAEKERVEPSDSFLGAAYGAYCGRVLASLGPLKFLKIYIRDED